MEKGKIKHANSFVGKPPTFRRKIEFLLQKIDLFGKPITFHYNENDTFRTNIGGISTILVGIILLGLFISEMVILFSRSDTTIQRISNILNIVDEPELYEIGLDPDFTFAFQLLSGDQNLVEDATYVTVTLNQVVQTRDSGGVLNSPDTEVALTFAKCSSTLDKYGPDRASVLGLSNYYCPTTENYNVMGTFYSNQYRYVRLDVTECSTGCAADLTTKLEAAKLEIALINNFVDLDDYDDPVQTYIDDGLFWDVVPDFRKKADIFVQENHGNFADNLFTVFNKNKESWFQVVNSKNNFEKKGSDNKILSVFFRSDDETQTYNRQAYTIVDSLAKIGGFFKIITAIFQIVLLLFVENLFFATMINNLYQLDNHHDHIYLSEVEDEYPNSSEKSIEPDRHGSFDHFEGGENSKEMEDNKTKTPKVENGSDVNEKLHDPFQAEKDTTIHPKTEMKQKEIEII